MIAAAAASCVLALSTIAAAQAASEAEAREDARALLAFIDDHYAYVDRFEGRNPARGAQGVDPDAVTDEASLLVFAECALNALHDHHAIMGISSSRSFALVPSYADLWIEEGADGFVITDVRPASPASGVGIRPGDRLKSLDGQPVEDAISALCGGPYQSTESRSFAARILAAGRRDRPRQIGIQRQDEAPQEFQLPSLYELLPGIRAPIDVVRTDDGALVLRFNNSLGDDELVAAIDAALAGADEAGIVIDLRDTPGGGNTLNARALLGRFVSTPQFYQRHAWPAVERATGVARRWVEEVEPRGDDLSAVPVVVLVDRWTGSMGEGLAMGFDHAAGATIIGRPMAGQRGAIHDFRLPNTGWIVKLPAERLYHVDGTPREDFLPGVLLTPDDAYGPDGEDAALALALQELARSRSVAQTD